MKVKELAENLKTTTVELINKLSNVKSSIPNNSKPVSNSLKSSEKRENQKNSVIQTNNNSHNNNNSNSNNKTKIC